MGKEAKAKQNHTLFCKVNLCRRRGLTGKGASFGSQGPRFESRQLQRVFTSIKTDRISRQEVNYVWGLNLSPIFYNEMTGKLMRV